MSPSPPRPLGWPRLYCLLAGAGDATTGVLLVTAPLLTLRLMGISDAPSEPVFVRFVGAFVAGVGLSYLFPFCYRDRPRGDRTLAVVLEVTALIRLGIALFVGWAIATGELAPAWASVLATDLVLAIVQIVMVKRRVLSTDRLEQGGGR